MTRLLTLLNVGDELPWRLDADGEPQWLTVIEVTSDVSDVVRSASSRPPERLVLRRSSVICSGG